MSFAPKGFLPGVADEREALRRTWADSGLLSRLTIWEAVCAGLETNKGRLIIQQGDERIEMSAVALHEEALALASALQAHGIGIGDVVAMQLPNWPEAMSLILAIIYAGAVALPIVPIYGRKEVGFILRQSRAKAFFIPDTWNGVDYVSALERTGDLPDLSIRVVIGGLTPPQTIGWEDFRVRRHPNFAVPKLDADAVCLLLYTSGTTSDPKGALHTHQSVQAVMNNMQSPARGSVPYRSLASPSTGHIGHVMQVMLVALIGGEVASMDRWSSEVGVTLIDEYGSTRMDAAPVFLHGLIDAARAMGKNISSMSEVKLGGTAIMSSDIEAWDEMGIHAFRSYGSTEHPLATGSWPEDPLQVRAFTDGYASVGTLIRILGDHGQDVGFGESGEIALIGPQQFVGYVDPALNADHFMLGGWFLSGDVGYLNGGGQLVINDRKKDIIIRGGENISAKEVEEAITRLDWVIECAAVSMPDPRMGERVCAFVIANDTSCATLDTVRDHFRAIGMAKQKTPEKMVLLTEFPRTPSGKIKKFELRAMAREMSGAGAGLNKISVGWEDGDGPL